MTEDLGQTELLLLDVDGVLTDGGIIYNDTGQQTKAFNVKDGLGLRLLMDFNIQVGIITGRKSDALLHRCADLGISLLYQGISDKVAALGDILATTRISRQHTAFVGDDLPDIPVMKRIGIPIAVSDAHEDVKLAADIVTKRKGGRGAIRELSEGILKAKGLWPEVMNRFSVHP